MAHPIQPLLNEFSKKYNEKAKELEELIQGYIAQGMNADEAYKKAWEDTDMYSWLSENVNTVFVSAAALGAGATDVKKANIMESWRPEKMKLSKTIHGASDEMRKAIVKTIKDQQKKSLDIRKTARALYDGYGHSHVVRTQKLPEYLDNMLTEFDNLINWSYRNSGRPDKQTRELISATKKAARNISNLSKNGAPNQALKTAYKDVLKALDPLNDKLLNRAIKTAVEEKSRYVAERIARTEGARAWAQSFYDEAALDDRVAALKWRLSSRHPCGDICDMYAEADLYGLGPGVFPKDKVPEFPVHPNCMCNMRKVYASELDGKEPLDDFHDRADKWLRNAPKSVQERILGVNGSKNFLAGTKDWEDLANGYSNGVMRVSLKSAKIKLEAGSSDRDLLVKRDLVKQKPSSLRKGIRNLSKQIEDHEKKIKNPDLYDRFWEKKDERIRSGLIKHWKHEIKVFKQEVNARKQELERRGKKDENSKQ